MSDTIRHTSNEKEDKRFHDDAHSDPERGLHNGPYDVPVVYDDDGKVTIPAGTFDPVYEAKARLLNRAVSIAIFVPS